MVKTRDNPTVELGQGVGKCSLHANILRRTESWNAETQLSEWVFLPERY